MQVLVGVLAVMAIINIALMILVIAIEFRLRKWGENEDRAN